MGEYRSLETTWHDDMEKGFVSMGLVRSIGIRVADFLLTICSNYDVFLTRDCLGLLENKVCSESDRETHPYFQCDSLVKHGICVTRSYSSGRCKFHRRVVWQFGTVSCLDDPGLNEVAEKYKKTVAC
ncbi:unnamed protein product [Brassica napus]|uniref:Uncharacterized protein n=2 Tax=Brassica TaxID=3705 RepID=A0A3P6CYM7_BRAOL|nr:unnamed protein product [Brassica napus]VDD12429.1 unnamed protein product [Brassica oleracea]